MKCKICDWREGLDNLTSALGSSPICMECFEANAETPVSIHEVVQWADDDGLAQAVKAILKGATVFVGRDVGYLPLAEYYVRMSQQQLTVVKTAEELEEEQTAHDLVQMQRRIVPDEDFQRELPPEKLSIFQRIMVTLERWFWREIDALEW